MVTTVEVLSSGAEHAQRWLADHRATDGFADISTGDWESSPAVINGVELRMVRLTRRTVYPNFVNCKLIESVFSNLKTDGHFWGASNEWQCCSFSDSTLRSLISPQNLFSNCVFERIAFVGWVACETLFESCRFLDCKFESLRTTPKRRPRWAIPKMENLDSSLQFVGCEFYRPEFRYCVFSDTAFSNAKFVEPFAAECDFTDIRSDCNWWSNSAQCDIFVSYLDHVIAEILVHLGPNSSAAKALTSYKVDYLRGVNKSKDYSACLYAGNVSDKELDVVDEIIVRIGPRFGL